MAKISKERQRGYFYTGAFPTAQQMKDVVDSQLGVLNEYADLPTPSADNLGNEYKIGNVYYKCVASGSSYVWQQTGTVVPSNSYTDITDKPKINGKTLTELTTVNDIGGIEKDASKYSQAASVNGDDVLYVNINGLWKKTTVSEIRKPNVSTVNIAPTDWEDVGGGIYRATKAIIGVDSSTVVIATPSPASVQDYVVTPYWLAFVGSGQITVETANEISVQVGLNVMYW